MYEANYSALLYEKVQAEYDAFVDRLKIESVEEVIERAYEKVIKEEMVSICKDIENDPKEAKALYLEKYPLDRMYQDWLKSDVSYVEMLQDSIDGSAKAALKEYRENQRESR